MTLQAFASGTFIVNIMSMEGLSVVLVKPIIDHSVELLQGGDVTIWRHLMWLVIGAFISTIIYFTSRYEQDSPLHFYGRLVIFLTVDAYCALRACQCLQRQAQVNMKDIYDALDYVMRCQDEAFVNEGLRVSLHFCYVYII
jgi:hypothetical protein